MTHTPNDQPSNLRSSPSLFSTSLLVGPVWRQYAVAFVTFVVVSVLNLWIQKWLGYQAIALVYLLSVVMISPFIGRAPTVFGTILTAAAWNYFFAPPAFAFNISDPYDNMMLLTYFVVTLTIGHLTTHLRAERFAERMREERASALYQLTREMAGTTNLDGVFCTAIREVGQFFKADVALFLPDVQHPSLLGLLPYTASTWSPNEKETTLAALTHARHQMCGRGTSVSPQAEGLYLPLTAGEDPAGVIALRWKAGFNPTPDQQSLLADFLSQISLALERQRLRDAEFHNKLLASSELLGRALLNSISHELRTPIAAITGAASGLHTSGTLSLPHQNLTTEILSASERLNRLVQSLLSAARIQSGQLRPKLEWCDVSDIVEVSLRGVDKMIAGHPVQARLATGLPLVKVDFVLMEQVMANLLLNVAAHTPPATPIEISASSERDWLSLDVADAGPGLPPDDLQRVFELFHRAPNAKAGGTGLGLVIVKGFVEAQGGQVKAANRPTGGAVFNIRLPAKPKPEPAKEDL